MSNFIISKAPPVGMSVYEWNKRIATTIITFAPPYCDRIIVSPSVFKMLKYNEIYNFIICEDKDYQAIVNGIKIYVTPETEPNVEKYSFTYAVNDTDHLSFVSGEIINTGNIKYSQN